MPLDGERIDHGLVKLPERFLVRELRLAQLHEQTVLVAVRDLLGAEGQVEQVFVDGAGERLLEQAKIKLLIVLRADRKRLPEAGENFAAVRNVAAVNGCDIGAIRAQTPPQLADLFSVMALISFTVLVFLQYSTFRRAAPEKRCSPGRFYVIIAMGAFLPRRLRRFPANSARRAELFCAALV